MRDAVLVLAHLADPTAAVESIGLIPSAPALRPADILTSAALPGRMAALDIGVTNPDAAGAGDDCCDAMYNKKRADYAAYLPELEVRVGIAYRPMVWSASGRTHPEAEAMLRSMATLAARRRGLLDHRLILRRVRAAIGVALVRRAVRMASACTPNLDGGEVHALLGAMHEGAPWPALRAVAVVDGDVDALAEPAGG